MRAAQTLPDGPVPLRSYSSHDVAALERAAGLSRKGRILLAVVLHEKHTQKTPKQVIDLAKDRRDRWHAG